MIIAVGFKIDNERAIQFRKWANQIVKDFTIKGWVMDDERLKKDGSILTKKYFEEQLDFFHLFKTNSNLLFMLFLFILTKNEN